MNKALASTVWTAVAAVAVARCALAAGNVKEVHKTVDLAANGRLVLETTKGWIDVQTWDRPQVEVFGRVEPDETDLDHTQAEKVRETEIRIEVSGSSVRIVSDYERVRGHGLLGSLGIDSGPLPFVRYTIKMPRAARLEIKDYKSETRIAALSGPLELNTYKGTVRITGMNGPVRLETYKGEVHAEFERFARSEFETYKGEIEVGIPRQTGFTLAANVGYRGDLRSDFESVERSGHRRGERRVHNAAANGGGPELVLRTHKGSFHIRAR